ncbi:MAG: hypothetical protein M3Z21_00785 [Pseudomonadota bacterium]|nr:hypothetical protein [Pseudomonadota bacterium]
MPLVLELPAPLEEELKKEAEKEGITATEHAALLLSISTALLREAEATPFQDAVKIFFSHHSLDAELMASALEAMIQIAIHDAGKGSAVLQKTAAEPELDRANEMLRAWRNRAVHQPLQGTERMRRKPTAMGKYAHVPGTSEDFAREKQMDIAREDRS